MTTRTITKASLLSWVLAAVCVAGVAVTVVTDAMVATVEKVETLLFTRARVNPNYYYL